MPTFDITTPDGRSFSIDAPDENTALQAVQQLDAPAQPDAPIGPAIGPSGPDIAISGANIGVPGENIADPAAGVVQPAALTTAPQTRDPTAAQGLRDFGAAPRPAGGDPGLAAGVFDRFTQIPALGFGDELTAAESALLGRPPGGGMFDIGNFEGTFGERFDTALEAERAQQRRFETENPGTALATDVAGGLGVGLVAAPLALATAPSRVSAAGRAATAGAGIAGVTGFGEGEGGFQNRATNAAVAAPLGAAFGAAGERVGRGLRTLLRTRFQRSATQLAPSLDNLRSRAQAAYTQAENAGVIIRGDSFDNFVRGIETRLADEAIDQTLHPSAFAAMQRIRQAAGQNITFTGLERLRQVTLEAAKTLEKRDARIANIIRGELDDFVDRVQPTDVLTGDAQAATTNIKEARRLWRQMSKGLQIEHLIDRADIRAGQFTQSGVENALRTEFRQFSRRIVDGKVKGFTQEEVEAIRRVAEGGDLDNVVRFIGKFAPRGPVAAGTGAGAGFVVGSTLDPTVGAILGAGVLGAGELGRRAATRRTTRNAQLAATLARAGLPQGSVPDFAAPDVAEALIAGQSVNAPDIADALFNTRRPGRNRRPVSDFPIAAP